MTDVIRITGGTPLRGELSLSASKNGTLPLLAAALLVKDDVILHNVPQITDVMRMLQLLEMLGATVERDGNSVRINATHLNEDPPDRELVASMRASFWVIGPLLARLGHAELPLPGGCAIGSRPVDYIINALCSFNIEAIEEVDVVKCQAKGRLQGAKITLDPAYKAVAATFIPTMTACLAEGRTVIENASADPETEQLAAFLTKIGAHIEGAGTHHLVIDGREELHGCEFAIELTDRIEAGTYLIAGAATRGSVRVSPIRPLHLAALLQKLEEMGLRVEREEHAVTVTYVERPRGVTVYTAPFPGFPTDLQSPMVALMSLAEGRSEMYESIYDGRLGYVHELRRMGAQVKLENSRHVVIEGVESLQGRDLEGADMRAGAALVVAALAADGTSTVANRKYIIRGYERIEEKLSDLGAKIALPEDDDVLTA